MCGRPGDNNDVVSILWLPLNAVITDVSMVKKTTDGVAASNVTSAKKTECTKCDDVFRNIASNGIVVTRLDKEGVQEDKFRTVRVSKKGLKIPKKLKKTCLESVLILNSYLFVANDCSLWNAQHRSSSPLRIPPRKRENRTLSSPWLPRWKSQF